MKKVGGDLKLRLRMDENDGSSLFKVKGLDDP